MELTNNKHVLDWVKEMADLTRPDEIVWIDGSKAQLQQLRETAFGTGELIRLNQKLLPG